MSSLWIDEPTILFQKDNILELWPFNNMNYNAKINAITRIIIVLTFVGYIMTESMYIVFACGIALASIYKMASVHKAREMANGNHNKYIPPIAKSHADFVDKNPYNNVLLTDIGEPKKKETTNHKEISKSNDDNKDNNLWDVEQEKYLDHVFYSTANNDVINDQEGFSNFLYGNMPSSKEDNEDAAVMRTKNNERYRLY